MTLYSKKDEIRLFSEDGKSKLIKEKYRTNFRRDFARLVHSPSFRRLQGKTQLFPTTENDYFRSRLTHSIEVAQIAKSIAIKINSIYKFPHTKNPIDLDTDLIEFASLAHDLGHPPFGHIGERALDQCMLNFGGFEGNAQTLRILTKIEKKFHDLNHEFNIGLNLTSRSLASILKYCEEIPVKRKQRIIASKVSKAEDVKVFKGYYSCESEIVDKIIKNVTNEKSFQEKSNFKTVECQIMDIADDIAYSTYDLEDSLKAGFLNPFDLVFASKNMVMNVAEKVSKELNRDISEAKVREVLFDRMAKVFDFRSKLSSSKVLKDIQSSSYEKLKNYFKFFTGLSYNAAKELASINTLRTRFTSNLVGSFIKGVKFTYNNKYPALSKVTLSTPTRIEVEILKRFTYEFEVLSHKIQITEYRGKEIIFEIFHCLMSKDGYRLLPSDFREQYDLVANDIGKRSRIICDFISGMTDRYAVEFYGRLKSENPETIFKPF